MIVQGELVKDATLPYGTQAIACTMQSGSGIAQVIVGTSAGWLQRVNRATA